jgi:hypothetical protein
MRSLGSPSASVSGGRGSPSASQSTLLAKSRHRMPPERRIVSGRAESEELLPFERVSR